jgi:murein DD-endopeptidase MepM/ murein hydrolase activator NlpD
MMAGRAFVLLLLMALAACDNGAGRAVTLPPASASYGLGQPQNYTVIAGDTVDSVAQQFNMPVETLIAANHLAFPYALHAGQVLFIPGQGNSQEVNTYYVVAPGDTLTRIARQHGTTVAALAELNALDDPSLIKVGQHLKLPPVPGAPAATASTVPGEPTAAVTQFPPAESVAPALATGSSKLTTESLAPLPGTTAQAPPASAPTQPAKIPTATAPSASSASSVSAAAANTTALGSQTSTSTHPSQVLLAPPVLLPVQPAAPPPNGTAGPQLASKATVPEPTTTATSQAPASGGLAPALGAETVTPPPAAAPAAAAPAAAAPAAAATAAPPPDTAAPRSAGKFMWPVNGKVISVYGAKDGGQHNDGINIAAPLGTPVRAADNGVVVYAGNELRGFGNLLLVRHADGWVSAYAHCDALLVKRGEQVKRGQVIARVGQTGAVGSPQLHFELRKSGQAVDPTSELGPQGA